MWLRHKQIWGLQDLLPCSVTQEINDKICDITFVSFSDHLLNKNKKHLLPFPKEH